MKTWNRSAGLTGFWVVSIIRTIVFVSSGAGNFAESEKQNGGSWGYEPPRWGGHRGMLKKHRSVG